MSRIQIPSPDMLTETGDMLRWWRQLRRGGDTHDGLLNADALNNMKVWVRTTTNARNLSYPAEPGHSFVVEFGVLGIPDRTELQATTRTGNPAATFSVLPYETPDDNTAIGHSLGHLYQGAVCEAEWHNGLLWINQPKWYWAKTGTTAITARSSNTPGSGTVTLQTLNSSGDFTPIKDTNNVDATLTVKNGYGTASGTSVFCIVQLREHDGVGDWWYLEEDCP